MYVIPWLETRKVIEEEEGNPPFLINTAVNVSTLL